MPKESRGRVHTDKQVEAARNLTPENKRIDSAAEKAKKTARNQFEDSLLEENLLGAEEIANLRKIGKDIDREKVFEDLLGVSKAEQAKREKKISSLADAKEVGKNRFAKLFGGLKKLAVEGGRGLMAVGLYPSAIIEKTVREIAGKIQVDQEIKRQFATAGKLEYLESIPADKRPDYYAKLTESLTAISRKGAAEVEKGYDLMHKKGKILRFLETHGGRVGGAMGDELTPSEY